MADDNNKQFFDALKKFSDELEATRRNENDTNDHDLQGNRWIDFNIDISTSSFSLETEVSSFAAQFSIPDCGNGYGVSASDSVAGAQHSIYEDTEENLANSFLAPVAASRGDFCRTHDTQSNHSEPSSSQHNSGRSNRGKVPWKRLRQASFGSYEGTCRKEEDKLAKFFNQRKQNPPVSAWPPQMSIESERNDTMAQTEDYIELSSASAIFSPIDDISSIKVDTHRIPLVSVAAAEAVSVAEPSGIQTQSRETGKVKPLACEVCGRTFVSKCYLQAHRRNHRGQDNFVCNTCGKRFSRLGNFSRHLSKRCGEKSHDCPWAGCDKKFKIKTHVELHLRTHTKEKPFTCEICHKGFAQKNNLNGHLRSHTEDKHYKCYWCGRSYKWNKDCTAHQKRCQDRK